MNSITDAWVTELSLMKIGFCTCNHCGLIFHESKVITTVELGTVCCSCMTKDYSKGA
jgi:hypothetical protein